ncbi:hypothetical protein PIB30_086340 [Stylosanthes scabra]|uniref:Uncharacterized protein n=1 Tax=Stylosanthes scabra TaxID=79078 RepID=A0ABU6YRW1_9FABA|nr:hypothetical protein [Stylosanthes scabra]
MARMTGASSMASKVDGGDRLDFAANVKCPVANLWVSFSIHRPKRCGPSTAALIEGLIVGLICDRIGSIQRNQLFFHVSTKSSIQSGGTGNPIDVDGKLIQRRCRLTRGWLMRKTQVVNTCAGGERVMV